MSISVWIPTFKEQSNNNSSLNRRLGEFGLRFLDTISNVDHEDVEWVVSSRLGDTKRMTRMFESVYSKTEISPTDFSMSVHNALIGFYSILKKHTGGHVSIAAGAKSFEMGLLESYIRCLSEKRKIGYVYYDFPYPEIYKETSEEKFFSCLFDPINKQTYTVTYQNDVPETVNNDCFKQFLRSDESIRVNRLEFKKCL